MKLELNTTEKTIKVLESNFLISALIEELDKLGLDHKEYYMMPYELQYNYSFPYCPYTEQNMPKITWNTEWYNSKVND